MKTIDPDFQRAVEEIEAVCRKYDMAGTVYLTSAKGSHFYYGWDTPTWSCLSFENHADGRSGIRIKSKSDVPGDREKLEVTCHMLWSTQDLIANTFGLIEALKPGIESKTKVEHRSLVGLDPEVFS